MRYKYYLAAATAFAIWGCFSFVLKPLHNYPSPDILFYRIFCCVILMVATNLLFRKKAIAETKSSLALLKPETRRNLMILTVISSLMLAGNWFFFIYVMNHISVKAASFAYLVCPLLTTVFAFIILKERLTPLQWLSVGLSLVSCVLLSYNNFNDVFFSIIVAATYAIYLVLQKKFIGIDKFLLLTVQLLITSAILLPFYPVYSGPLPQEASFYGYIAVIAIGFTIIPMLLNLFALKGINSSTLGILLYINPIIGFLLAAFYYKESISAIQIVAYSIIVISIIIFNIGSYLKLRSAAK
ncbi:EamA family transporter [Flavobacterium sp. Sd200]|uniref:EamA family transporter n=1 Tax=Flavobacterium sp. Sd200 TaxID=2692211 RepID=UPI001369C501|nr:EamA family transporter [Flavobacterium sp. Sd200]MXN90578.1 EamA family transporter [Flavobacterium sp. Sd200]